jgi:hypothetical protein
MKLYAACAAGICLLAACDGSRPGVLPPGVGGSSGLGDGEAPKPSSALTRDQLRDPENCAGCHPNHYKEWSSSMHAYAAKDPVFVAMNKRGQRETGGKLGDFCIRCHAPMAVVEKLSSDGLNLADLPERDRGVSCYFCHSTLGVEGDHNAMLALANDTTLRGPIADPRDPGAHVAEYSASFEDTNRNSTAMCGGCHDIVTQTGVHLERTFEEYKSGLFSMSAAGQPSDSPALESCPSCHMPTRSELAAVYPPGGSERIVHEHLWPGIDVPLSDFPNRGALRSAIEDCQLGVASIGYFTLEVTPPNLFTFSIETNAGHNQPSGSAQDRRMWLEFLAYDGNGALLDQGSSGNIADGELEEKSPGDPKRDPNLFMLRDRIYDDQGQPVHMFWQAATSSAHPSGYESTVLPVRTSMLDIGTHSVQKQYSASGPGGLPARISARLRMRPIGMDVLDDLVASGDLDPAVAAQVPTYTFGAQLEWTPADGAMKAATLGSNVDCKAYRCLLYPGSQYCE